MKKFAFEIACPFRKTAAVAIVMLTIVGCGHREVLSASQDAQPVRANVAPSSASGCGASITVVITEYDADFEPYGIPQATDTASVCETWTGSDYTVYAKVTGSSDNLPGFTDAVQAADYKSGQVTGFGSNDAPVGPAAYVAPTAFDLMNADAATRQASYDDPYYGVRAVGPCSGGVSPCDAAMNRMGDAGGSEGPITRRGIRKLVEGAEELPRTAEGYRRFKRAKPSEETEYLVDPENELLVGEEYATPAVRVSTRHLWKKVVKGWVRDRTEIRASEKVNRKTVRSSTTITFLRVETDAWGQ